MGGHEDVFSDDEIEDGYQVPSPPVLIPIHLDPEFMHPPSDEDVRNARAEKAKRQHELGYDELTYDGEQERADQLFADMAAHQLGALDLLSFFGKEPEPATYLETDFIEARVPTSIFSQKGVGKSPLVADCAICWSQGRSLLDVDDEGTQRPLERPQRVLVFDNENGARWWQQFIGKKFGPNPSDPPMHPLPMVLTNVLEHGLHTKDGAEQFWSIVQSVRADVVVIDTLSAFTPGVDENSPAPWMKFNQFIVQPSIDHVTLVVLDHMGKDAEKGQTGHHAKSRQMTGGWAMEKVKDQEGALKLTNDKNRNYALPSELRIFRTGGINRDTKQWESPLYHYRGDGLNTPLGDADDRKAKRTILSHIRGASKQEKLDGVSTNWVRRKLGLDANHTKALCRELVREGFLDHREGPRKADLWALRDFIDDESEGDDA